MGIPTLRDVISHVLPTEVSDLVGLTSDRQRELAEYQDAWNHLRHVTEHDWTEERFRGYSSLDETAQESVAHYVTACERALGEAYHDALSVSTYIHLGTCTADELPARWTPKQMTPEKQAFLKILEHDDPAVAAEWINLEQEAVAIAPKTQHVQLLTASIVAAFNALDNAVMNVRGWSSVRS